MYRQARYYDPVIGRFYSNDPVGTLGHLSQGNIHGFNRYAYANNNPYAYVDPDGNNAVRILATVAKDPVRTGRQLIRGARIAAEGLGIISAAEKAGNGNNEGMVNGDVPAGIDGAVDLVDQLAGEELVGEIEAGEGKVLEGMGDGKFDPNTGTHDKVAKNRTNADGTKTELHAERNRETGKVDSAKIKQDGKHSRENNF